jgi:carboxylesterase type B
MSTRLGMFSHHVFDPRPHLTTCLFSGDPEHMILWGQSAGAGSVNCYAYSYTHDAIVTGFVADSGPPSIIDPPEPSGSNFTKLASLVGCANLSQEEEFECMQKVDARTIQKVYSNGTEFSFVPRGDDVTAPINPTKSISEGKLSKLVSYSAITSCLATPKMTLTWLAIYHGE